MHTAVAAPKPSTAMVRIRFIRASLVTSDSSDGSFCGCSKYPHVAGAALLHGVHALHGLMDLAHNGKLLAHLETDLEALGELLDPIVVLGQTGQHLRVVGVDSDFVVVV